MNNEVLDILKKYWGFESFRSPQDQIIDSILNDRDTLALMPTGGGKSICFQVPALHLEGITLVISPLIALMTDQIENLKKRGVPAACLISGMSYRELDQTLENAVNGQYKLLYLSPERLKTELFRERMKRMKVDLLAVDEAHCISQWGFDFRPAYREISALRDALPHVPVLALTATATPRVVEDIMQQLSFREKHVVRKSFRRDNLVYRVIHSQRKWSEALKLLRETTGSAIVYMRSRKQTAEIAKWLGQNQLNATWYHAGLDASERRERQRKWLGNEIKIMVSTNAFGMGVDKPDVSLVIHLDLPDSLEAYFQEAGRAGRNGDSAESVILIGPSDEKELTRRYLDSFPDIKYIRLVYQALANHLQLAIGSGELQTYDIDIPEFCREYELSPMMCYQALQIMEREGLISLSDGLGQSSRIKLSVDRTTLYDFQLRNPGLDIFIKTLTRSYGGLEIEYTPIDEGLLSNRMRIPAARVRETLRHLQKQGILEYSERSDKSRITLLQAREKVSGLRISDDNLKLRYKDRKHRIESVLYYVNEQDTCRSILLLRYFGEESQASCGSCDVCLRKAVPPLTQKRFELIRQHLDAQLSGTEAMSIQALADSLPFGEDQVLTVINFMLDEGSLHRDDDRLSNKAD